MMRNLLNRIYRRVRWGAVDNAYKDLCIEALERACRDNDHAERFCKRPNVMFSPQLITALVENRYMAAVHVIKNTTALGPNFMSKDFARTPLNRDLNVLLGMATKKG